jgi:PAS domain-containing protein
MRTACTGSLVWVVTDSDGRIEALSSAAAALLGLRPSGAGRNLLLFFPRHRRVLSVDMEVALTGWPSTRTVVVTPTASRPRTVRYLVSRRVLRDAVELQWTIEVVDEDFAAAS